VIFIHENGIAGPGLRLLAIRWAREGELTVFVGKGPRLQSPLPADMCSHSSSSRSPARRRRAGRKVRSRTTSGSRLRFKNYDELNAWLLDKCIPYEKAHRHPELSEQTICDVFEASGRTWSPTPAGSMASTRSRHQSQRPASSCEFGRIEFWRTTTLAPVQPWA
jgi:hypothetical protein